MTVVEYWFDDLRYNWKRFFSKKRNLLTFCLTICYFLVVTWLFKTNLIELEKIPGVQLHDVLLDRIPSIDVSFLIFLILYAAVFYNYIFLLAYPKILEIFLFFYATALLLRLIMLFIVKFEPPIGMIILYDPILANSTYNGMNITKDLFFSGHMVAMLCAYYTIPNKVIRYAFALASVVIAILLMIQHIHYVIDIFGAVIIVNLLYRIYFRKIWLESKYTYQYSPQVINYKLE